MAFKPKSSSSSNNSGKKFNDEERNFPVPKAGPRKGRISLIVDLGEQNREDFEDKVSGEKKPQAPVPQVAIFADLVNDVVDYGGKIGKGQYRLMLNKSFQGDVQGVTFKPVAPRDNDGNLLEGKPWSFHPANLLTKLCKAVGKENVAIENRDDPESLDISLLLNQPIMCQVEVKETPAKNDKKDAKGNPIIYRNVNFKGASPIPMIEDDETGEEKPMPVAALTQKPRCITFDDATAEDIQFIRSNLLSMIKNANNYAGSQIQRAIEEFEASGAGSSAGDDEGEAEAAKPAAKKEKAATPKKSPKAPVEDDEFDDAPF